MALLAKVEALESENAALRAEVAALRSRLNLNSKNSHKPPSSDGLSKKPGLPKGPPKKSGGQFGQRGKTLKMGDSNAPIHTRSLSNQPKSDRRSSRQANLGAGVQTYLPTG